MTFLDDWTGVLRVIVMGSAAYASIILVLRASGKRTLSKLNAFDLTVTVALGSVLATTVLSDSLPLAEGLTGMALLVALQFGVAWASVRSHRLHRLVTSAPTILLADGAFRPDALQAQRVTRDEVMAALRGSGVADPADVAAVVLEADGSLSVVRPSASGQARALDGLA